MIGQDYVTNVLCVVAENIFQPFHSPKSPLYSSQLVLADATGFFLLSPSVPSPFSQTELQPPPWQLLQDPLSFTTAVLKITMKNPTSLKLAFFAVSHLNKTETSSCTGWFKFLFSFCFCHLFHLKKWIFFFFSGNLLQI